MVAAAAAVVVVVVVVVVTVTRRKTTIHLDKMLQSCLVHSVLANDVCFGYVLSPN